MALAETADRGVARHRADACRAMRHERRARARPRGRGRRLAAGMAAAHDDDVVVRFGVRDPVHAVAVAEARRGVKNPVCAGVSRETPAVLRGPCFT
jgi:hypothetical protein